MGNKASNPQRRNNETNNGRSSVVTVQQQTLLPPPPPQCPPLVMAALSEPDLPLSILPSQSNTPNRTSNVLTPSTPDSPNSIMASAIPEVYYASDMIHVDNPEPAISLDFHQGMGCQGLVA